MRIGVIGTGTIAAAVVRGIAVSQRSAALSAGLDRLERRQ